MLLFSAFIPGRPPSKKNTKKFFRGRVIYSKQFREWEKIALTILKPEKMIDEAINAKFTFHFKNRQAEADVSNLIEAPQDALQKANVISDDRLIHVVIGKKVFDGTEGTKIELFTSEEFNL